MSQKVFFTGSRCMLAADLVASFKTSGYEVIGLPHDQLDITDIEQVRTTFKAIHPNIVVNTPGIGVDECEMEPALGFKLHAWAAAAMAGKCEELGAKFVYLSTCGLFGDAIKFYSEYDPLELKTQYAVSKYQGEMMVSQRCRNVFIIRPGWLFGGTIQHRRNFVYQRYLEAMKKPLLTSAMDKYGCPSFTSDVADKIVEIVEIGEFGTYHVTNSGMGSRFDYVKYIVESFGLDTVVEPVDSSHFPRSAPVPNSEMLDNLNVKLLGLEPMDDWHDALQRYVRSLNNRGMLGK